MINFALSKSIGSTLNFACLKEEFVEIFLKHVYFPADCGIQMKVLS